MAGPDVLVVEPNTETRTRVGLALKALDFEPLMSGSLAEALGRAREEEAPLTVIIADVDALLPHPRPLGEAAGDWTARVAELREGVERLRTVQRSMRAPSGARQERSLADLLPEGEPAPEGDVPVILTSAEGDAAAQAATHAAAIDAGAEAFVRGQELTERAVLRSYLRRYMARALEARRRVEVVRRAAEPRAIAETFDLPDDDLRDGETGRWDAKRIAPVLGVDLTELVRALGANYSTVARTPASEALQPKLAPFANVITMARQAVAPAAGSMAGGPATSGPAGGGNAAQDTDGRLRKWLRRPQPALRDRTPLDALLQPGLAPAVAQWVTRVWLGEPG